MENWGIQMFPFFSADGTAVLGKAHLRSARPSVVTDQHIQVDLRA